MTSGDGVCLVVVTDQRVLILNDSDKKRVNASYPLVSISNVGWSGGAAFGKLSFTAGVLSVVISNVPKRHGVRLLEVIEAERVSAS
jgi:hypothetical protein